MRGYSVLGCSVIIQITNPFAMQLILYDFIFIFQMEAFLPFQKALNCYSHFR